MACPFSEILSLAGKLEQFSKLLTWSAPHTVDSPVFFAFNRTWMLKCFPLGDSDEASHCISVALVLLDAESVPVRAKFQLAIIDSKNAPINVVFHQLTVSSAAPTAQFVHSKFIDRSELTPSLLPDDTLTLRLKLAVIDAPTKPVDLLPAKSQLLNELGALLSAGLHSDVTLVCEGEEIRAHKAILAARSPVFKAMFANKMSESLDGKVMIDDASLAAVHAFVK